MLKEVAVERYSFTCAGCGHTWSADYDVQHVADGHGVTWEYYSLNGIPVPSPTAPGTLSCPRCGASWIHFRLMAVRTVPLAEPADDQTDPARPRQRIDAERKPAREQAALRRGDEPGTAAEAPVPGGGSPSPP